MNNTATAISKENILIERAKYGFLQMEKEELAEVLAVLTAKLLNNGISYGYSKEECIEEVIANYTENPIRDTFYINFSGHDEKVRKELKKEFLKNVPSIDPRWR